MSNATLSDTFQTVNYRIFDEDEDGHIYAADMVEMLTNLGDKLTKSEARKLVQNADATGDGLIDYTGF